MNRTLNIQEWHELAQAGNAPPVRIPLMGYSMLPLIRYNRDYVTIVPLDTGLRVGDIVLFAVPSMDRYVMHRVWDLKDQKILTWGDNCQGPDGWLPLDAIWGKAVLIERGRRKIKPDPRKGVRWAKFMHKAGKPYRFCRRYKYAIIRRINKLRT